ncbi:hypothetical protein FPV67DRAFT_1412700 [Lyophyllum atratum]|nr:hypothetical protein FPV67DRAFT_1412700 [Lyophyllum atratum]
MSTHGSSSSDEEAITVRLEDIPTILQLYKEYVLTAPPVDQIRYKHNDSLLDRISLYQGDITKLEIDAIVNAANKSLLGAFTCTVDGAIHRAAGPHLLEECKRISLQSCIDSRALNGCCTGQSKITRGYRLPSRHVIHTVGPVYSPLEKEEKARQLASCYRTSLEVGVENGVRHIAFPSISTGIYGYPIEDATHIALNEVRQFVESEPGSKLERVIFVVFNNKDRDVYRALIPEYFPPANVESEVKGASETKESSEAKETPGTNEAPGN